MRGFRPFLFAIVVLASMPAFGDATEFCLAGEFDLGARFQGLRPGAGEVYPARWCVTTDDASGGVLLAMQGNSNPDMEGSWSVAFVPPDLVRIVNRASPPDIEFRTPKAAEEARRTRMLDPQLGSGPGALEVSADLPLRGRAPVRWAWNTRNPERPILEVRIDDEVIFRGTGERRVLEPEEAIGLWEPTPGADPIQVPGDRWPARVAMELVNLTDGVYVVRGVRTGFHHMVVKTNEGLVVADAPAGWVELHQFPPTDLVPGLGISGLSERLIDFLGEAFPGIPVRAVALTHHHDDHAGGARAFAAAGADVYAPAGVAAFLELALNRDSMPPDRLSESGGSVRVLPVASALTIDDAEVPVLLLNMGASPHVVSSLGVLANGYFFQSDLHVPNSDADTPRPDRSDTECWFARWAVTNLPADTVVINTHSAFETPVSRLETYLESGLCSSATLEP